MATWEHCSVCGEETPHKVTITPDQEPDPDTEPTGYEDQPTRQITCLQCEAEREQQRWGVYDDEGAFEL